MAGSSAARRASPASPGLVRGWPLAGINSRSMRSYLAAHDAFVAWIDSLETEPPPAEVERQLHALALRAADRGMTSTHWTFVVDGLVAHVTRRAPEMTLLAGAVARGFDLCSRWSAVREEATHAGERRSVG
jgi:hypothetical protein